MYTKERLSFVSLAPREMPWVIGRALEEKLTACLVPTGCHCRQGHWCLCALAKLTSVVQ